MAAQVEEQCTGVGQQCPPPTITVEKTNGGLRIFGVLVGNNCKISLPAFGILFVFIGIVLTSKNQNFWINTRRVKWYFTTPGCERGGGDKKIRYLLVFFSLFSRQSSPFKLPTKMTSVPSWKIAKKRREISAFWGRFACSSASLCSHPPWVYVIYRKKRKIDKRGSVFTAPCTATSIRWVPASILVNFLVSPPSPATLAFRCQNIWTILIRRVDYSAQLVPDDSSHHGSKCWLLNCIKKRESVDPIVPDIPTCPHSISPSNRSSFDAQPNTSNPIPMSIVITAPIRYVFVVPPPSPLRN